MAESVTGVMAPEVPVVIELGGALADVADPEHQLNGPLRERVTAELSSLFRELGVAGSAAVELSRLPQEARGGRRLLAVRLNGRPCRYPDELLVTVAEYARGGRLEAALPSWVATWCTDLLAASDHDEAERATLLEFIGLASLEIVKLSPGNALGDAQLADEVLEALREVLDLGISLADRNTIDAALAAHQVGERDAPVESLISSLRRDVIEIRMPRAYLEQITTREGEEEQGKFEFLRDGLFAELGLVYPDFRFVVDDSLKPRAFTFTLNHIQVPPRLGLEANECLIDRVPGDDEGGSLEVLAVTRNPATGRQGSIVPLAAKADAEAAGFTTWTDVDFLILSLAADLRMSSACFVHEAAVDDILERLSWVFPALVSTVRARLSPTRVTRCIRALVSERVSVRNLRTVLEELLLLPDAGRLEVETVTYSADGAPDAGVAPVDLVRLALARQIRHQAGRTTNTVVVYLLDPAIEAELLGVESKRGLTEDRGDAILDAIWAEVAALDVQSPGALVPEILTSLAARRHVRELLAEEFPRMAVLAHEELRESNIQPIARIALA